MFQSIIVNETKSNSAKVDCAKECPCGVPVIPVPDQWLEVMVTGGFKVWHIIFIIIAFIVTMTVVYCCFHRCRIPRTKQEIEADLMRTNLASKFSEYLQELPNEPTTFVEALKKVQEFEEKLEQDDAKMSRDMGARKRMGWLKLKGKGDKEQANKDKDTKTADGENGLEKATEGEQVAEEKTAGDNHPLVTPADSTIIDVTQLKPASDIAPQPVNGLEKPIGDDTNKLNGISNKLEVEPKSNRRRRHKPLSRTKASGRIDSQDGNDKKPQEESNQATDKAPEQLAVPELHSSSLLKNKSHRHSNHRVRIKTKTKASAQNGNSAIVTTATVTISQDETSILPSIWPAIRSDKSYHVMFQLQIFGTKEKITVEEWASFEEKLFRFDIITVDGRISYLTNGNTGEILRYRPYTCDLLTNASKELGILDDLFQGYSLGDKNGNKIVAYGIGPLWLRALDNDAKVSPINMNIVTNIALYFEQYDAYSVNFKSTSETSRAMYEIKLYFRQQKNKFIDFVEWMDVSKNSVLARAKMVLTDMRKFPRSVFNIPIGYGCKRGSDYDHPFNVDVGLKLFDGIGLNQVVLEVTASRPKDEMLRLWSSEKYTVRLVSGSINVTGNSNTYWIVETQSRDPDTSRLKKTKLVWASNGITDQAVVYNIDNYGSCRADHQRVEDHIRLNFPTDKNDLKTAMSIGTDVIAYLFNDNGDYHPIREEITTGNFGTSLFTDVLYEKRIENFREVSADGETVWSGPVSIIKEVSYIMFINGFNDPTKPSPFTAKSFHTTLTIIFYSDDKLSILYKAVLDLVENESVDISFLHREMDISTCFTEDQKEDIVIKYPVESADMIEKLKTIEDIIKVIFSYNLFTVTSIQPIQVSNIAIEFDNFYMYIRLTIIDLPLTQLYNLKRNLKLAESSSKDGVNDSGALIEKLSASVDKCATSCDHYNCHRFSFDPIKHLCRIEVRENAAKTEQASGSLLYEKSKLKVNSPWFKFDNQENVRTHLRPQEIVDLLKVFNSLSDDAESTREIENNTKGSNMPLVIRIERDILPDMKDDLLELKPSSIDHDMDSMNEYMKESRRDEDGSNSTAIISDDWSNIRLEFNLVYEDRIFNDRVSELVEGLTYDQCAQYCEDENCRSFSYCDFNQGCRITTLHSNKELEQNTARDARCKVFALDYLSKFEDFGKVLAPIAVKTVREGATLRDCANACMEEKEFNCQGFFYCINSNTRGNEFTCLLSNEHIDESGVTNFVKPNIVDDLSASMKDDKNGKSCKLYSRSYLSQFNEYHGRSIKFPDNVELSESRDVIEGFGAEACSKKCIERSCLAFDVCLEMNGKFSKQICQLAHKEIRKSFLEPRKRCTTFVLSDRSHFNSQNILLISDKPDRPALTDEKNTKDTVIDAVQEESQKRDMFANIFSLFMSGHDSKAKTINGSHWLAKLLSLIFGVLIGVGIVTLWNSKDDIYIIVSSVSDRFRTRR